MDGKTRGVVSEEALIKQPEFGTMNKKHMSFFNFYTKISETTQQDSIHLGPE
jgi:hypothetical protein